MPDEPGSPSTTGAPPLAVGVVGCGSISAIYLSNLTKRFPEITAVHGVKVRRNHESLNIVLRCRFDPKMSIKQANEISRKLEATIRNAYPIVGGLEVHEEPA